MTTMHSGGCDHVHTHSHPEMKVRLKEELARFPNELPYEYEEQRGQSGYEADAERAKIWAGWGNPDNYQVEAHPSEAGAQVATFVSPEPEAAEHAEARRANSEVLAEFNIQHLAQKALENFGSASDLNFTAAIAFMCERDRSDLFNVVEEAGVSEQLRPRPRAWRPRLQCTRRTLVSWNGHGPFWSALSPSGHVQTGTGMIETPTTHASF